MLEEEGACGLPITHRISSQKHQRILAFLSSIFVPTAGVTSCDSPQCTSERVVRQVLQSTKPADRNSCWNTQNRFFFPRHPGLCMHLMRDSQPWVDCFFTPNLFTLWFRCLLLPSSLPRCSVLPSPPVLGLVLSETSFLPEALHLHQSKFCWTSSPCYSPSLPAPPSYPLLRKSSGHFQSSHSKHVAQPCPVVLWWAPTQWWLLLKRRSSPLLLHLWCGKTSFKSIANPSFSLTFQPLLRYA